MESSPYNLIGVIIFALIASWMVSRVIKDILQKRRAKEDLKERVHDAIEKITADGKVEGPKGPYVRHKPWRVGTPHKTPDRGPLTSRGLMGQPKP